MRGRLVSVAMATVLAAATAGAVDWRNLDGGSWVCGPKVTPESLEGKVVLVDEWGVNCPPCRALLPRLEQIWQSFRGKGLVLIGSHRQGDQRARILELRDQNKLTYPIYLNAGVEGEPSNGGGIPFLYVINSAGKIVYSGRDEREATAAIVNAITDMPDPNSLLGDVVPVKFKAMAKDLVLGKNVESKMTALKAAAKKSDAQGTEASSMLKALEESRDRIAKRIRKNIDSRPGAALTDIQLFQRTWPSAAADFAEERKALEAKTEVRKLQQAAVSLEKVKAKPPKNSGQARTAISSLNSIEKNLNALAESEDPAVKSEAASILAAVKSVQAECEDLMPKKK